jgi:hypothetical protein
MTSISQMFSSPTSFIGGIAAEAGMGGFGRVHIQEPLDANTPSIKISGEGSLRSSAANSEALVTTPILLNRADVGATSDATTSIQELPQHTDWHEVNDTIETQSTKPREAQPRKLLAAIETDVEARGHHTPPLSSDQNKLVTSFTADFKNASFDATSAYEADAHIPAAQAIIASEQMREGLGDKSKQQTPMATNPHPSLKHQFQPQKTAQFSKDLREKNIPRARLTSSDQLNPGTSVRIGTLEIHVESPLPPTIVPRRETPIYQSNSFNRLNIRGR